MYITWCLLCFINGLQKYTDAYGVRSLHSLACEVSSISMIASWLCLFLSKQEIKNCACRDLLLSAAAATALTPSARPRALCSY